MNCAFATNANVLIPISLLSDGLNFLYISNDISNHGFLKISWCQQSFLKILFNHLLSCLKFIVPARLFFFPPYCHCHLWCIMKALRSSYRAKLGLIPSHDLYIFKCFIKSTTFINDVRRICLAFLSYPSSLQCTVISVKVNISIYCLAPI